MRYVSLLLQQESYMSYNVIDCICTQAADMPQVASVMTRTPRSVWLAAAGVPCSAHWSAFASLLLREVWH